VRPKYALKRTVRDEVSGAILRCGTRGRLAIAPHLWARRSNLDAQAVRVSHAIRDVARLQRANLGVRKHVSHPFVSQSGLVAASDSQRDSRLRWTQVDPIGLAYTKSPHFEGFSAVFWIPLVSDPAKIDSRNPR
jgi:hypothetical protein